MTARPIITVGGIDGSGKSSFARRLQAAYAAAGLPALRLHIDDFRRGVDWTRADRAQSDIYGEDYFDFAAVEACLDAFRAALPSARRPLFDGAAEQVSGDVEVPMAGARVAIVEGVFMMRLPSADDHVRVWMKSSYQLGRRRIIERGDPPWRTEAEWSYRIDHRYFPAQRRYLADFRPEERADVVIDNEDWQRPVLVRADLSRLPEPFRGVLASLLPGEG
jgi:uridine kinase